MLALLLLALAPLDEDPSFAEGMWLFDAFEYVAAVQSFERALTPERAASERARVHVMIGMSLAELSRPDEAQAAFARAHALDAGVLLPPLASPKIVALFEAARPPPAPPPAPPVPPALESAPPPDTVTAEPTSTATLSLAFLGGAAAALAVGGAVQWFGYTRIDDANRQTFQDDAAEIESQAIAAQITGQTFLALGVLSGVVGAGLGVAALVE